MSVDAFVSYATPDRAITMALVEDLEARGLKCWVAPRDVQGGSKYAEVILKALSESKVFLLVFSENSNNSEHVQREVERALNSSKTIVPVRIADIFPSGAMDYYLATLHWIDAFGESREGSFDVVADAMAGVLGRKLTDPDEAVGADAVPALAGAGVAGDSLSTSAAIATAEPKLDTSSGSTGARVGTDSPSAVAKSGSGRGGMIAAGVAAILALAGLVVWKAVDWGGGDDSGEQAAATGGDGKAANGGQSADAGKVAKADDDDAGASAGAGDDGKSTATVETKSPDKTTKPGTAMVAAAGAGVDPKVGDGGAKMSSEPAKSDPTPKPPPPPDPVADSVAAAQKAWQSGERKLARETWLVLLRSPAGKDLNSERLGEDGVKLLNEMVVVATKDAEGEGDNIVAAGGFSELDEWKALLDLSESLGLDELVAERQRFQIGWQVAQAEALWASGSREEAAKSLTEIAGLGAPILERMKIEGDYVGSRLAGLLNEVTRTAAEGALGTTQALTERWRPSLQLAADSGDVTATGVLATLAWKADDRQQTAALLKNYEVATRGVESLDPGVSTLLAQALTKAQAEMAAAAAEKGEENDASLLTAAWEPAFNIAYRHELPGALEVVAEVTHRRDPGEAVALYRRLYDQAMKGGSLRKRITFCLQMLARYDLGEEAKFYHGELQNACELVLAEADGQPSSGGQLIEKIPEIRDAADAGVSAAQYIMGDLTANGKGVEKDEAAAFAFFKNAADGGYARAKYAVGECLRDGRGTDPDAHEAVRIWRAMKDDEVAEVPQALFNAAQLLPEGAEQTELYADARRHYAAKVEDGQVAKYGAGLGFMLVDGLGGDAEPKRGYELLLEAADRGSDHAAFLAGYILVGDEEKFTEIRKVAGIALDEKYGKDLIKRAARLGYPNALTWCEQNGVDIAE